MRGWGCVPLALFVGCTPSMAPPAGRHWEAIWRPRGHIHAVNIEPDPARFPALLRALPAYPAILADPGGPRQVVVLGLGSIPTTWILDGKGKVSWYEEGWDSSFAAALTAKLNVLVGGGT